jgi:hypothetical protein
MQLLLCGLQHGLAMHALHLLPYLRLLLLLRRVPAPRQRAA